MHLFSHHVTRLILSLAAALICVGPFQSANAERPRLGSGKMQNWTLANGEFVQAAIINYSRHSRVITLEMPSGSRVHVAPRDLAGASKFNWLTSDAFIQSLSGYQVPKKAALPLVQTFLGILIAAFLGFFLTFWVAVSVLSSHRSLRRAFLTFLKFSLFSMATLTAGLLVAWGIGKYFSHSSFGTLMISSIYLITIALTLAMSCRIIGRSYEASEWTGIQALVLAIVLFCAGSFVIVIGMPRAMSQPGVDDWLTEQVLTPLELA